MANDFTGSAELVEQLRSAYERNPGHSLYVEAADLIERFADRINHLTNVSEGKSEMIAELRAGLVGLRAMCAPEQSA